MMTLDDTYFMKQALIEAGKAAERGEVPVGAVVVCKERIIARAHNLTETLNDVTAHAEMQAITAAANVLGGKYLPLLGRRPANWFLVRKMISVGISDMRLRRCILKRSL